MFRHFALVGLLLVSVPPRSVWAITLATNKQTTTRIVVPIDAELAERTAADELAMYLLKATGAKFEITTESDASETGSYVYVGPTRFAERAGLISSDWGPEEWVMRIVGEDLILVGGRPRGTLYAVYRFLEDVIGVHWWNPWEETVPSRPTLVLGDLDRRGAPVFNYRDIYMLYGQDGGRFAARNRLNRDGDQLIAAKFGGSMDYGPPQHVHTFYRYVPPGDINVSYIPPGNFFAEHPEWFSLINGKRTALKGQLCLTNRELRTFFLRKLRANIQQSREVAEKAKIHPPLVFSVSQNDWSGACQCAECQAIAKAEGSEAGPLLDFVNYMADGIKDDYPDVFIDTLAYAYTENAPKTIRPRDNVIIRLCDLNSNFTKPITDPQNRQFQERLLSWAKITNNLRVWDYAVNYGQYPGFPMPTAHTYPVDYRFYAEHNVVGVFTEHEYPVIADMRDFKVWMMMKLLEDPYRDYGELVRTFTDGFYGPAGKHVRRYLRRLEAASDDKPDYMNWMGGTTLAGIRYLDLEVVREAISILDDAEKAAGGNPVLLRRVGHARLSMDRAAVAFYPKLICEWVSAGNPPETMPLDREAIAQRYKDTWHTQIDLRFLEKQHAAEYQTADAEVAALVARPTLVRFPEKFRGLPTETLFDYIADTTRNAGDIAKVVPDPEATGGITNRLELFDDDPETNISKYKLPMPWGLYDQENHTGAGAAIIKPQDVPGPGYQWYKMGPFVIGRSCYLYFFWSWIIQLDIDNVVDPENPEQKFDIWADIKFEGPGFPHGNPADKNAICVERVVLIKAD